MIGNWIISSSLFFFFLMLDLGLFFIFVYFQNRWERMPQVKFFMPTNSGRNFNKVGSIVSVRRRK